MCSDQQPGTWDYTVGDANYQVVFSHYNSSVIN
jgi:hypothetical protein